ncbi:MAG: hypothetical protein ABIT68_04915 [Sphingomicrobium sp.]
MLEPNNCGFSGNFSAVVLFGVAAGGGAGATCANAVPATARIMAAAPHRARVEMSSEPAVTSSNPLQKQP